MAMSMPSLWTSPGWRAEAEAWIRASVQAAGHQVSFVCAFHGREGRAVVRRQKCRRGVRRPAAPAMDHGDALVSAGLVPLLPAHAAESLETLVERLRRLPPTDAAYVAPELADLALQAVPTVREVAERLASSSPSLASLEHNDLHRSNVFIPRADESTLRFFDFGDALWAHPFTTLFVPVSRLCQDWETEPDDPRIRRVVDSYLEVWSDLALVTDLRESARLDRRLGPLHRLESWRRPLEGGSRGESPDVAGTLEYWWARVAAIGQR